MTVLALELNDAAIAGVAPDGLVWPEPGYVPGYAAATDSGVVFGSEAWRSSRLQPGRAANRYWQLMSTEPLASPVGAFTTSADLVHAHLERLLGALPARPSSVVCAVPGCWSTEQLGLLLGVAEELALPVRGLVDSAVAATRREYPGQDLLHLDCTLHEMLLTRLRQDRRVSLDNSAETRSAVNVGIEQLERTAAGFIAGRFLEVTRFDPLHDARSEQILYDHLYDWLRELQRQPEISALIEFGGNEFRATIRSEALAARVGNAFEPAARLVRSSLGAGKPVAIQVSHRLAEFPGIVESLVRLQQASVFVLEPAAAAWGALQRVEQFARKAGGVGLTTALEWDHAPARIDGPGSAAAQQQAAVAPTHLLYDGRVYRLGAAVFNIGVELATGEFGVRLDPSIAGVSRRHCSIRRGENGIELVDHSRFGTQLNGHPIDDAAILTTGDVITIGRSSVELRLVTEVIAEEVSRGP